MPKLSKHFIETVVECPVRGQSFYPDSTLPGFWLRVTPRHKFYVVKWQQNGIKFSVTLGSYDSLPPELARQIAAKILFACEKPFDADEPSVETPVTLGRVFEKYMSVRPLRLSTGRLYRETVSRCLDDWKDLPIANITKNMVESRHRDLCHTTRTGSQGKGQANLAMKLLRALCNFAADYYETVDAQPVLLANPVKRLSQNKSWYRLPPRQTIIPDHKLGDWCKAVMSLKNRTAADYLLLTLLTGLRRNEAATLRWCDVDFEERILTVRSEISKNHREHKLPLSSFVLQLLQRRQAENERSQYVFPGRGGKGYVVGFKAVINEVRAKSKCKFVIHDLRRTFLTMAERLDVPHYTLKKLANHVQSSDVTAGYMVIDVEKLRMHICRINDQFLALLYPDLVDK